MTEYEIADGIKLKVDIDKKRVSITLDKGIPEKRRTVHYYNNQMSLERYSDGYAASIGCADLIEDFTYDDILSEDVSKERAKDCKRYWDEHISPKTKDLKEEDKQLVLGIEANFSKQQKAQATA